MKRDILTEYYRPLLAQNSFHSIYPLSGQIQPGRTVLGDRTHSGRRLLLGLCQTGAV